MHVFFSGIGGGAIGPLALIAKQVGYKISGSDKQTSLYIDYLRSRGVSSVHIGQSYTSIKAVHDKEPIDWYVYSSAVAIEKPDAPEFKFCLEQNIKMSKRDEFLNQIIQDKKLRLIAIAGTHGKTTTTAMVIWLFKQLKLPVSYSVGAKIPFGDMGQYEDGSKYFVLECDEFDRNFLAYKPHLSLVTGVSWDHHEIFPTRENYRQAFRQFINQSNSTIIWQQDFDYLNFPATDQILVLPSLIGDDNTIRLFGQYNRLDAWLASQAVHQTIGKPIDELIKIINRFPGLQRRMEEIAPGLYSDYAHTPEKIRGAMSVALEMAGDKKVFVVYEPLTNRRQHYMLNDYKDCFKGAAKVYWLPSYLAREDPNQRVIPPSELISHLTDPEIAEQSKRDKRLERIIRKHLTVGDMVVALGGGSGDSLDEWLRTHFSHYEEHPLILE